MDAETKRIWLEALANGKYTHIQKQFVSADLKCHCATGVLIDLLRPDVWTENAHGDATWGHIHPDFDIAIFFAEVGLDDEKMMLVMDANDNENAIGYNLAIQCIQENL